MCGTCDRWRFVWLRAAGEGGRRGGKAGVGVRGTTCQWRWSAQGTQQVCGEYDLGLIAPGGEAKAPSCVLIGAAEGEECASPHIVRVNVGCLERGQDCQKDDEESLLIESVVGGGEKDETGRALTSSEERPGCLLPDGLEAWAFGSGCPGQKRARSHRAQERRPGRAGSAHILEVDHAVDHGARERTPHHRDPSPGQEGHCFRFVSTSPPTPSPTFVGAGHQQFAISEQHFMAVPPRRGPPEPIPVSPVSRKKHTSERGSHAVGFALFCGTGERLDKFEGKAGDPGREADALQHQRYAPHLRPVRGCHAPGHDRRGFVTTWACLTCLFPPSALDVMPPSFAAGPLEFFAQTPPFSHRAHRQLPSREEGRERRVYIGALRACLDHRQQDFRTRPQGGTSDGCWDGKRVSPPKVLDDGHRP